MNPQPHCRSQLISFLILILLLALITGCEEGENIINGPPVEDHAVAMIAQASLIEGTMLAAINDVRLGLFTARSKLQTMDFSSPGAGVTLENLVVSNDNVWGSGIINTGGAVLRVYPTELEPVVGTSWINRPEVDSALAESSFQFGEAFDLNGVHSALFISTIARSEQTIIGVVFSAIQLDTLFQTNLEFVGIDTVDEYEFFALDDTGEVLFNTGGGYINDIFTDENSFSLEQTEVALSMVEGDSTQGNRVVDLTDAPGGEGMQYLGWVRLRLLENRFWVLAVSSTVPEEEQ